MADPLTIPTEHGSALSARHYAAPDPQAPVLALAHGAGAPQQSGFMVAFAEAMQAREVAVVTFNFPYMEARRRAPDRAPVLEAAWRAVIRHLVSTGAAPGGLVIGGKSMGGRIASHVLCDPAQAWPDVAGLVLLGYPLHPPGQPDKRRAAHLPALRTDTLVVQGSQDTFGTEDEVRDAFSAVPARVEWLIVPGGDHSFTLPRRAGRAPGDVLTGIYDAVGSWVRGRTPRR